MSLHCIGSPLCWREVLLVQQTVLSHVLKASPMASSLSRLADDVCKCFAMTLMAPFCNLCRCQKKQSFTYICMIRNLQLIASLQVRQIKSQNYLLNVPSQFRALIVRLEYRTACNHRNHRARPPIGPGKTILLRCFEVSTRDVQCGSTVAAHHAAVKPLMSFADLLSVLDEAN